MTTKKQESFMRWALALALEGQGKTSPNPIVGAVVVKKGRIVGEGYHRKAGAPHAEIHALKGAGKKAKGADLYVTLEPCAHTGRTPPCVGEIVAAGVRRVFVGTRDPNPKVHGRGIRWLKKSGVEVIEGVLEKSCVEINASYNKFIQTGIPFVTAKAALSLDGKIAALDKSSRWITNKQCREYVHKLRAEADAVMVGAGTARNDNPGLDVRLRNWSGYSPKAVVVDEKLALPRTLRIFKRPEGQLIVATTARSPLARRKRIESLGQKVIICRENPEGKVDIKSMLEELGGIGITSVLLEGGGRLFADFFKRRFIDRFVACISPKFVGGCGFDLFPGVAIGRIENAVGLTNVMIKTFGDNVVIEGEVVY